VIAHAFAHYGGPKTAAMLDGMFAFVVFEEDVKSGQVKAFAARDPVGIKPLYYGRTKSSDRPDEDAAYVFSSELKALVGHVEASTVVAMAPGHHWSPEDGLVCFYNPEWLRNDNYAPWEDPEHNVTDDEIREAFSKAVQKRMMADVEYGFFLSGGVDSCIVSHDLLPLWRAERSAIGDDRPIPTYTVGMENSPDVMAARAMVDALGGAKYVDHHVRLFTPDEVFDLIPKIIYHMETYEAELIRSSIPNWLLAERASRDVRMVLTGEGSDELFAGYLYFQDAESPRQVQNELRRIYNMLGNVNLHRTDRMTMAHGLEARVPFLDTEFTRLVMSIDPARKMVNRDAVRTNTRGREKTFLRELFEGPNSNGDTIPTPILWRAKAMQCEGVGEDWVAILQRRVSGLVSDAEMAEAHTLYPVDTPHTKEELYYRRIFDEHFHGLEHTVKLWEGGGRAMGAEWKSDMYTREGLKNVNLLTHSLQQAPSSLKTAGGSRRGFATMPLYELEEEPYTAAIDAGYDAFEACLTCGGDDRSLILETGTNKYHIRPQPIDPAHVFRGSCTGNPPTALGYQAAKKLFHSLPSDDNSLDKFLGPVIEDQRTRLFQILDLPEGAEIIFCPSGSDAEYIPIAIARALNGDMRISNGVVQVRYVIVGL
jgi:asparagine synthase (glutamine-hydrolysing)